MISSFGYIAVVIGTILEGETVLVLAGLAAHRGYLDVGWVAVAAFVGGVMGDQLAFHVGRLRGEAILARYPSMRARVDYCNDLMARHQNKLMVGFRLAYGVRFLLPLLWGRGGVSPWRFLAFDAAGAAVWAVGGTLLGYSIGQVAEQIIHDFEHYELLLFGVVAVMGALFWVWRVYRARRVA